MSATTQLNAILHNYADVIIGRLAFLREKNINVISIISKNSKQINALSDKLIDTSVNVTSNLSKMC